MSIGTEVIELLVKLVVLQISANIEEKKGKLLLTEKAKSAYVVCDGLSTMEQMAKQSSASKRFFEDNLPIWEGEGLVLSVGFGKNKRYLSIENISIYLSALNKRYGN